jgi:hypothetical protein
VLVPSLGDGDGQRARRCITLGYLIETIRDPDTGREYVMTVVRISNGRIDPANMDEAEQLLIDSEAALREPLQQLRGLVHYYVGIDREQGFLINVSVWETLKDAHQMDSLQAMLDQRPILQAAGISFEPITNHDTVWTINP